MKAGKWAKVAPTTCQVVSILEYKNQNSGKGVAEDSKKLNTIFAVFQSFYKFAHVLSGHRNLLLIFVFILWYDFFSFSIDWPMK